ncbi:Uncharacterised protein [Vibrio cholerae]|nr:Uncharacterised protein [Vibrio cholerae]CSI43651.1 Uncharacterised protein [Vibrio cholerae]
MRSPMSELSYLLSALCRSINPMCCFISKS